MSEISMTAGGYRYRGTRQDAPARRKPGRKRHPLTGRVVEALRDLGGEATTAEIRQALGTDPADRRVPDALHRLAKTSPPEVTAAGDRRGGQGRPRRWRLTGNETYPAEGDQPVITSGYRGVYPVRDRWQAKIRHEGRWVSGMFSTPEDAAAALRQFRDQGNPRHLTGTGGRR